MKAAAAASKPQAERTGQQQQGTAGSQSAPRPAAIGGHGSRQLGGRSRATARAASRSAATTATPVPGTTLSQGADFGGQSSSGQTQSSGGSSDTLTADRRRGHAGERLRRWHEPAVGRAVVRRRLHRLAGHRLGRLPAGRQVGRHAGSSVRRDGRLRFRQSGPRRTRRRRQTNRQRLAGGGFSGGGSADRAAPAAAPSKRRFRPTDSAAFL